MEFSTQHHTTGHSTHRVQEKLVPGEDVLLQQSWSKRSKCTRGSSNTTPTSIKHLVCAVIQEPRYTKLSTYTKAESAMTRGHLSASVTTGSPTKNLVLAKLTDRPNSTSLMKQRQGGKSCLFGWCRYADIMKQRQGGNSCLFGWCRYADIIRKFCI